MNFDNQFPEWNNEGTEPSTDLKNTGFQGGYKPPATVFNWFWAKVMKAVTELQTKFGLHADSTSNPHSVTKEQVGLGNVDNTSDANKPVSTATQTALNTKANLSGGNTFSGEQIAESIVCDDISTASGKPYISANQNNKLSMSWLDDTGELPGSVPTITGTKYNCSYELSSTSMLFYNPNYMPTDLDITGYCFLDTNGTEYTITEGSYNSGPPGYIITGVSPSIPTTSVLPSSGKIVLYKKGSLQWCNPANKTASVVIGTTNSSCKPYTEQEVDFLCTGTNDQDVIKDAIDYVKNWCMGSTGGKIVLLEGTYNIDNKLQIVASDITIEGMGNATKIVNNSTIYEDNLISFTNTQRLTIRNCYFKSTSSTTSDYNLLSIGSSSNPSNYFALENNYFEVSLGFAINISVGDYARITGNTFATNSTSYAQALNIYGDYATVSNNTFVNTGTAINVLSSAQCVTIANNVFRNNGTSISVTGTGNTIVGNTIYNSGITNPTINLGTTSKYNLVVGNNVIGKSITDSGTNNTKTANNNVTVI